MERKPTMALFPGTFYPWHLGHQNIWQKAVEIWGLENVTIALGENPDKKVNDAESIEKAKDYIRECMRYQSDVCGFGGISQQVLKDNVIYYTGYLHKVVEKYEKMGYNTVVVRGLRNGNDLSYEQNFYRILQKYKPDLKFVYIHCDNEYDFISSSMIKKIEQTGGDASMFRCKTYDKT